MKNKTQTIHSGKPFINTTVFCAILFAAAVLIRFYFAVGDLWLDEVWSIVNITKISSFGEIFTAINSYNNHFLNSIFIYVLGPDAPMMLYRLPAVIGSVMSLVFVFLIARKDGQVNALIALTLAGFSYFFIMLSSESRGYGLLMGFAYGALYYAIKIFGENDRQSKNIFILWGFIVLGFLSHLTFLHFLNGLIVWSVYKLSKEDTGMKEKAIIFIKVYGTPILFLVFFYFFAIRGIVYEDGPVRPFIPTIHKLFHYVFGFPLHTFFQYPSILIVSVLTFFGIYLYKKTSGPIWLFFVTVMFLSPMIVFMTVFKVSVFAPRHFFMNIIFVPLLFSRVLSWLFLKDQACKVFVLCIIGLFLCAQAAQCMRFSKYKRGTYTRALEYIVKVSGEKDVTLASDHDFRNMFLIRFYKPRVEGAQRIHYVRYTPEKGVVPDFFLVHDFDSRFFPEHMTVNIGTENYTYELMKVFRYDAKGMSGYDWYVYKKL